MDFMHETLQRICRRRNRARTSGQLTSRFHNPGILSSQPRREHETPPPSLTKELDSDTSQDTDTSHH